MKTAKSSSSGIVLVCLKKIAFPYISGQKYLHLMFQLKMKIILLLISATLIGCNHKKQSSLKEEMTTVVLESKPADTIGGLWILHKLNDTVFDMTSYYGFESDQPTLCLEPYKNRLSGFSGCNGFSGKAHIDSLRIKLTENIVATEIGCGNNKWEYDYFDRLSNVKSLNFGLDSLKIISSGDKSMTYYRRHLHPLELNDWLLTKVNDTIFDIKKAYGNPNEPQPVINFNFHKNKIFG